VLLDGEGHPVLAAGQGHQVGAVLPLVAHLAGAGVWCVAVPSFRITSFRTDWLRAE